MSFFLSVLHEKKPLDPDGRYSPDICVIQVINAGYFVIVVSIYITSGICRKSACFFVFIPNLRRLIDHSCC